MKRLLLAEWLKLTTIRLLWAIVPGAIVISMAAVAGAVLSSEGAGVALDSAQGVRRALHVTGTGSILVLVLGIVISAGEYRTQTATDTFLTTPNRSKVTTAKLLVGLSVGIALGVLTAAICLGGAIALYDVEGERFPIGDTEVWTTLGGAVVYAGLFSVLGVAFGTFVRNQVVGIVAALAWLLVVENILFGFTNTGVARVIKWLPGAAGQAIVRTPDRDLLSPGLGIAVLLAYGIVIAGAGIVVSVRRDA